MDRGARIALVVLAVLCIYPFLPVVDWGVEAVAGEPLQLDRQLVNIFIFAVLALCRIPRLLLFFYLVELGWSVRW